MKKTILIALSLLSVFAASAQTNADDPVADPAAVVTAGSARFTVLTDRLIRMEWAEDGVFEDRATLGVVNRRLEVPAYKVSRSGSKLTIKTSSLTLVYKGGGKFDAGNLSVSFRMPGSKKNTVWTPGSDDVGNLQGTARTLDGCGNKKDIFEKRGMDKGVISRDGWAIVDESSRHVFTDDDSDWGKWVAARDGKDRQDLYIFAYGHDYTAALGDFTKIAGSVPMPPKYAFGFWQSRYWAYSDYEFIDMAERFRREDIPSDIMIIDMDWHNLWTSKNGEFQKDCFGLNVGWTGYSWNRDLFPCPESTLEQLHNLHFKTALNLHPASGIQPCEDPYESFVADYLSRTTDYDGPRGYVYPEGGYLYAGNTQKVGEGGQKAPVPFRMSQREWADSYFKTVLRPLEEQGVDFWWLDWQQWKLSKYCDGLSNTFWLNHTFYNDIVRRSASEGIHAKRPLIYHRWGGIGSHRYQVGFSGDTRVLWSALEMEPWFTATSSNVCYGYWGHDLGGHYGAEKGGGTDPELFTRWVQFGVFTPIFKIHSTKSNEIERRIWNYPSHSTYLKDAIRLRYSLSPYIYDAARYFHDSGIGLCRPLYYYAPEDERSYSYENEYYFGPDILATAIARPADPVTGLSPLRVFFPEGSDWYDVSSGEIFAGGSEVDLSFSINENPWFVRAGAIIPMAGEGVSNLQESSNELRIFVAPGDGESSCTTFEDDGKTQAYEKEFARTAISKCSDSSKTVVRIGAREGSYEGVEPNRKISVILEGVYAPVCVKVNGEPADWARFPEKAGRATWGYDGKSLATIVSLPESDASEPVEIECVFDSSADRALLRGVKGLLGRMTCFTDEIKMTLVYAPDEYLKVAGAGGRMTEYPESVVEVLRSIDRTALGECWKDCKRASPEFITRMQALVN